jgi:hypothetical protein
MCEITGTVSTDWKTITESKLPQQGKTCTCGLFVLQYIICTVSEVDCHLVKLFEIFPTVYRAMAKTIATDVLHLALPEVSRSCECLLKCAAVCGVWYRACRSLWQPHTQPHPLTRPPAGAHIHCQHPRHGV